MAIFGAFISVVEQTPAMLVATISDTTEYLPMTRPDGVSPMQDGDYVMISKGAKLPFTIKTKTGQEFEIKSYGDTLTYSRSENKWYLNASKSSSTGDVLPNSATDESISETATSQAQINTENKNRLQQVVESAVFQYQDNKILLQLKKYAIPSITEDRYLLNTSLDLSDEVKEEDLPVLSSAVYKELIDVANCKFEYGDDNSIHLYLINRKGDVLLDKKIEVDVKAIQDSKKVINSNGVYEELLDKDNSNFYVEIGVDDDTLHFYLTNNRGEKIFEKDLTIDGVAENNSHNLINSNAVYKERLDNVNCYLKVENNKLHLYLVNYRGNVIVDKSIDIDTKAIEGSTNLITSDGVYKEILNNTKSSFVFSTTDNNGDSLSLDLVNNNDDKVISKKVEFNDNIVFVKKEQTIENKTLDFDKTSDNKNIATNIPLDSLATLTADDAGKVLQVNSTTYKVEPQYLTTIKYVDAIPTTQQKEGVFYRLNNDKTGAIYYWDATSNAYIPISASVIKLVDELPTTDIQTDLIYNVKGGKDGNNDQFYTYNSILKQWNQIYTDQYGLLAYQNNTIEITNKSIDANYNELGLLIDCDAFPTADINDNAFYYLTTTKQIYTHKTGQWELLGDRAIEKVEALPTSEIHDDHFYYFKQNITLTGTYSIKTSMKSTCSANETGLVVDGNTISWVSVANDWSTYYNNILEDNDSGDIFKYSDNTLTYLDNKLDDNGLYYYDKDDSKWHKLFAPETTYGDIVYTKKTQTIINKTIAADKNNLDLVIEVDTLPDASSVNQNIYKCGQQYYISTGTKWDAITGSIIEVDELPTTDIRSDVLYKVKGGVFYFYDADEAKFIPIDTIIDEKTLIKNDDNQVVVNIDKDTITYNEDKKVIRTHKVFYTEDDTTEPENAINGDIWAIKVKDGTAGDKACPYKVGIVVLSTTEQDFTTDYPGTTWEALGETTIFEKTLKGYLRTA